MSTRLFLLSHKDTEGPRVLFLPSSEVGTLSHARNETSRRAVGADQSQELSVGIPRSPGKQYGHPVESLDDTSLAPSLLPEKNWKHRLTGTSDPDPMAAENSR